MKLVKFVLSNKISESEIKYLLPLNKHWDVYMDVNLSGEYRFITESLLISGYGWDGAAYE
jgi:hypothetical protein